jgi:hypothetical protein
LETEGKSLSNYRVTGSHQLNKWLWEKLQGLQYKGAPAFQKYGTGAGKVNLVPFVPSQQLPEFTNIAGGAPFIVYTYSQQGSGSTWFTQVEQVAYVIYDNDEERLRTIHTYMVDLLRRADWTAQEINKWIYDLTPEPGTQADPFEFKTVQVVSANGPEPFETQDGRQGAIVVVRIVFTHDLDNQGLRI